MLSLFNLKGSEVMKIILSILAVVLIFGVTITSQAKADTDLKTVDHVDVEKYLGTWYQIAHIPLIFEGGNCACARQVLSLRSDGLVGVYNSCNSGGPSGELREIRGEGYNDDPATNSKFTIDFHLPHKGTYWIIGLAADYSYAVVSDKTKSTIYILSKTPTLSSELYNEAMAKAAVQLDTSKVVLTEQMGCKYPAL